MDLLFIIHRISQIILLKILTQEILNIKITLPPVHYLRTAIQLSLLRPSTKGIFLFILMNSIIWGKFSTNVIFLIQVTSPFVTVGSFHDKHGFLYILSSNSRIHNFRCMSTSASYQKFLAAVDLLSIIDHSQATYWYDTVAHSELIIYDEDDCSKFCTNVHEKAVQLSLEGCVHVEKVVCRKT